MRLVEPSNVQTDSIIFFLKKSPVLHCLVLLHPSPKNEMSAPAYCIILLVWWSWYHCRTTWLCLHDYLRCKITGLPPREGLNAPLPLFLLCRPLCCLTFRADSIITTVWEEDKKGCLFILPPTKHPAAPHEPQRRRWRLPEILHNIKLNAYKLYLITVSCAED